MAFGLVALWPYTKQVNQEHSVSLYQSKRLDWTSGLSVCEYWAKPNSSNTVYSNSNSADSIDV